LTKYFRFLAKTNLKSIENQEGGDFPMPFFPIFTLPSRPHNFPKVMRNLFAMILLLMAVAVKAQPRTIHVFVALCDNANQGIVPVPAGIGNLQNAATNLYWGCGFGVKTFFSKKSADWKLVSVLPSTKKNILERLLFRHTKADVYMLAEAYDGATMADCIGDYMLAANRQHKLIVEWEGCPLPFGGSSDLMAFIGHNGLMDGEVNVPFNKVEAPGPEAIILACYSKSYFAEAIKASGAQPLLWTTHLMAPEAYVLEAALKGWVAKETAPQIEERAAQAYNLYQKCGINGARNLFTTGF
jgi:hypothetical protein